jgi:nitrogen regulatory protein P-II 2
MAVATLKLVTVVAEPVLEDAITKDLRSLGATGFTITEGRGEGSRGLHAGDVPGQNVRIETIVRPEAATRILAMIAERFFAHYSVVAWAQDVDVVRGDKF